MNIIHPDLEKYILSHLEEEDELLQKIYRDTHVKIYHPRRSSGHYSGKTLEMISKMIQPKCILEIGTFTGYSTICLAKGLSEGGLVYSFEINDELEDFTRENLRQSDLNNKIKFIIGNALELIPEMEESFDLVFIDGEKDEYLSYYECILPKMKKGGFIIADNVLWSGKVVEAPKTNDHFTKGILAFNRMIKEDSRVEQMIWPIDDGIMLIRVK